DGYYEFKGVAPGTYHLGAQSEDIGAFNEPRDVSITGTEERVVDLELDLAATINGAVVDQHRAPVGGVFVRWTNEKTGDLGKSLTDPQGRFRCTAMTGGARYRAAVYATSAQQRPFSTANGEPYPLVELRDGSTTLDGVPIAIQLDHLPISGRVVDLA